MSISKLNTFIVYKISSILVTKAIIIYIYYKQLFKLTIKIQRFQSFKQILVHIQNIYYHSNHTYHLYINSQNILNCNPFFNIMILSINIHLSNYMINYPKNNSNLYSNISTCKWCTYTLFV